MKATSLPVTQAAVELAVRDHIAAIRAQTLREAADALYSDDGPSHPLSTAAWLRQRADALEIRHHMLQHADLAERLGLINQATLIRQAAPPDDLARPRPAVTEGERAGEPYASIHAERLRAHAKHGAKSMEAQPWDDPIGKRLRILVEEVGEVAREFNDADIEGRPVDRAKLRSEVMQVSAMAVGWLAAIDGSALASPAVTDAEDERVVWLPGMLATIWWAVDDGPVGVNHAMRRDHDWVACGDVAVPDQFVIKAERIVLPDPNPVPAVTAVPADPNSED